MLMGSGETGRGRAGEAPGTGEFGAVSYQRSCRINRMLSGDIVAYRERKLPWNYTIAVSTVTSSLIALVRRTSRAILTVFSP